MPRMEVRTNMASSSGEPSNPQRRLEAKDLPSLRRAGKGLSGVVYETAWEGNKYARKDFPVGRVKREVFMKEVPALFELEHPNVVKCYRYAVGGTSCSLLLEYLDDSLQNTIQGRMESHRKNIASSTSTRSRALALDDVKRMLSSKVKERAGADVSGNNIDEGGSGSGNCLTVIPFEIPEAVDIMSQIATGMKYLHNERIVHGDLKPKNVLVCSDESGKLVVKVTDFGLVQTKKQIRLVSKRARHFEILTWKAPELFSKLLGPLTDDPCFTDSDTGSDDDDSEIIDQGSGNFLKSRLAMADVYSFGLICSHLLGGKVLYPEWSLIQLREQRSDSTFRPELLSSAIPECLRALIYSTLQSDPLSRPTFSDICAAIAFLPLQPMLRDAMKVYGKEDPLALTCLAFDNSSLEQLPSEIGALTALTTLSLHGCSSLKELPPEIGHLTALTSLNLKHCSRLQEVPTEIGNLKSLTALSLEGCSSLKELPISNLTTLNLLNLERCKSLKYLPLDIGNSTSLTTLKLAGCSSLAKVGSGIDNLKSLTTLTWDGCSSLTQLPSIGSLATSTALRFDGCSSLEQLPSEIGHLTAITTLSLEGCSSLKNIPSEIVLLRALETLNLSGCSTLKELPSSIGFLRALRTLSLFRCTSLDELPEEIYDLPNLTILGWRKIRRVNTGANIIDQIRWVL